MKIKTKIKIKHLVLLMLSLFMLYANASYGATSESNGADIAEVIKNVKQDIFANDSIGNEANSHSLFGLIFNVLVPLIGVIFVGSGIKSIYGTGANMMQKNNAFYSILSGILLINFPFFVSVFSQSIFGGSSEVNCFLNPSQCMNGGGTVFQQGISLAFMLFAFSGGLAIVKGIMIIKNIQSSGQQTGEHSWRNAIMFIVGGTLMVNIKVFLGLFANWFGQSSWLHKVLQSF